jgi:hypothetical protein
MNKRYNLKKISGTECQYMIFSVDYHRIEDYISDLSTELSRKSYKGLVMFDLLLSNGMNQDRYVKAVFDGKKFLLQTMETVDTVDEKIKKVSSTFYQRKPEYLENSILSRAQKFLIRRQFAS